MIEISRIEFLAGQKLLKRKKGPARSAEVDKIINLPIGRGIKLPHNCQVYKTGFCSLTNRLHSAGKRYGFKVRTTHSGGEFMAIKEIRS